LISDPQWKRDATGWRLMLGKRCFGRIVSDAKYSGMWRSPLSDGRLSDMANISWAKEAVMQAARRELEFEARSVRGRAPRFTGQNEGVSETKSPYSDFESAA
jgi:hypothetical protein